MTIYLDHAASTPLLPEVHSLLVKSLQAETANAEAKHLLGRNDAKRIESARKCFIDLLQGGAGDKFIFTSSATESNNTIISSLLKSPNSKVILSLADHASVTVPVKHYCTSGARMFELPLMANLDVDLTNLEKLLNNNKPDLLILTHVNSVSGHILDVAAIASLAKQICPNVHVHVDAAQGFAKLPLDLSGGYIDSVSISAHKIGGPKGISGLYIKAGVNVAPLLLGGGHECGMRSSTPATALIEAFALAARLMCASQQEHLSHTASLVDLLKAKLIELGCDVKMPFVNLANQSPYIVSLFVPPLAGDVLMRNLEQEDVMISTRSACSSKNNNTPEFKALNINPEWMSASLRVSFSARTTVGDVVRFCEIFADVMSMLLQFQDR